MSLKNNDRLLGHTAEEIIGRIGEEAILPFSAAAFDANAALSRRRANHKPLAVRLTVKEPVTPVIKFLALLFQPYGMATYCLYTPYNSLEKSKLSIFQEVGFLSLG